MATKRFSGNAKALREVRRFAQQSRVNVQEAYFAKHAKNNNNNINDVEDGPLRRIMKRRMPETNLTNKLATTYRPSVHIRRKPKSRPSSKISLHEKNVQPCPACLANLCFVHKRRLDGSSSSLATSEHKPSSSVLPNTCVMPNELIAKILHLGETDRVLRALAHTINAKNRRKLAQRSRQMFQLARMSNADTKDSSSNNNNSKQKENRLDVPPCKYATLEDPLFDGIVTKEATELVPKRKKRDSLVMAGINKGNFVSRGKRSSKAAQKANGGEKPRRKQMPMTVKMHKNLMMQRCQNANPSCITKYVPMKSSEIFVNRFDSLESAGKQRSTHLPNKPKDGRKLENERSISQGAVERTSANRHNEKSQTAHTRAQQTVSSTLKVDSSSRDCSTPLPELRSQSMDNDNARAKISKSIKQPGLNWLNLLPVQQQRWQKSIKFGNRMANSEDVPNTATATSAWPLEPSVRAGNDDSRCNVHYNASPGALKTILTDNEYGKKALLSGARWPDRPFLNAMCGFGIATNAAKARTRDRTTVYRTRSKSFNSNLLTEQMRVQVVQTENHSTFAQQTNKQTAFEPSDDAIDALSPSTRRSQQKCAELQELNESLDQATKVLVESQQQRQQSQIEEKPWQQTGQGVQSILINETNPDGVGLNNQVIEHYIMMKTPEAGSCSCRESTEFQ